MGLVSWQDKANGSGLEDEDTQHIAKDKTAKKSHHRDKLEIAQYIKDKVTWETSSM